MGDILPFSLFNVNFKEYQCFYSLIEYLIHRDLSVNFLEIKERHCDFFGSD